MGFSCLLRDRARSLCPPRSAGYENVSSGSLPRACNTKTVTSNRKHVVIRDRGKSRGDLPKALSAAGHLCSSFPSIDDIAEVDLIVSCVEPGESADSAMANGAGVPVLVVAPEHRFLEMVDAGCRGFVEAGAGLDELMSAVEQVLSGNAAVPHSLLGTLLRHVVTRRRLASELVADLTNRERQVFELAVNGANKEDIARQLYISPATARTHLQRVYKKMGVHSQTELMALADDADREDQRL